MNVDHELVQAIDNCGGRCAILADVRLWTRMSMVYWGLQGNSAPLIITPRLLHRVIQDELNQSSWKINDRVRPVEMITPQSLISRQPELRRRVVMEMSDMGATQKIFIRRCVTAEEQIVVRCLHRNLLLFLDLMRPLGFTCFHYGTTTNALNELVTQIKVLR